MWIKAQYFVVIHNIHIIHTRNNGADSVGWQIEDIFVIADFYDF